MCVLDTQHDEVLTYPGQSPRICFRSPADLEREPDGTELTVQRCLNRLRISDQANAKGIVREIISVSADRLRALCKSTLSRNYPRLAKGPLNLRPEEVLSSVVQRLMKAMQSVHPAHFRQFFALAVKHIRWELNEQAREMDNRDYELLESDPVAQTPVKNREKPSPTARRILQAIATLPQNDRETFELVRLQGMSQMDAAEVLGVSVKTVQRRLNRVLPYLCEQLRDVELIRKQLKKQLLKDT